MYHFEQVEEEMVFKFAVTSNKDLLGFLYLEIPQKFKFSKDFRLEDWFPIKQLETDQVDKKNFMARVSIKYSASRKILNKDLLTTNLGKTLMKEEMVKDMRQKLLNIHKSIDVFQDEGFRHLGQF